MKLFKNILATLLVLMVAVITFFTWNLIFSFVSNYQSMSLVAISSLPMVLFMVEIYIVLYAVFDYVVLERRDPFFFREYSIVVGIFALLGIACSILDGTIVYHTFFGDYIFAGFPIFMLIIHTLFLGISEYIGFISFRQISQEKPEKTWKNPRFFTLRRTLVAFMLMFGLEKLGGFVLLPFIWSSYDSVYVIPFYIQILVPIFLFVTYMVDRYWLHDKRKNILLLSIAFGYSICSLIYMIVIAHVFHDNYQLIANPLSAILQGERLITKPIGFIIMYAFCILFSGINLVLNIIRLSKEKKVEA